MLLWRIWFIAASSSFLMSKRFGLIAKKKSEDSLKEEIKKLTDEGKKKDDEIKAGKDKIAKLEEDNNNLKAESENANYCIYRIIEDIFCKVSLLTIYLQEFCLNMILDCPLFIYFLLNTTSMNTNSLSIER